MAPSFILPIPHVRHSVSICVCVCECLCWRGWLSISKLAKPQMVLIVVVQSAKCAVDFVCLVWLRRQGRMQYIQEKKWPGVPNPKSLPLLLSMSPECFHSTNSPTHKYALKKSHTHIHFTTHTYTHGCTRHLTTNLTHKNVHTLLLQNKSHPKTHPTHAYEMSLLFFRRKRKWYESKKH